MRNIKLNALVLLLAFPVLSVAKQSFLPDDFKRFENTNSCVKCDLISVPSYYKDHDNALLEGARMMYNYIHYGHFNDANFVGAYLTKSSTQYSGFRESDFTAARMNQINAYASEYSGAKFASADLSNADFTQANLSSADFTNAKVDGADFTHTILIGSNITAEQLSKLKSYECAVLPNGELSLPKKNGSCD